MHHREEAEIINAPYFAEEVRRELMARYGDKVLYQGGLSVRTSLDARLQAAADKALRTGLIEYDRGHGGWRGAVGHIDPGIGWPNSSFSRTMYSPYPIEASDTISPARLTIRNGMPEKAVRPVNAEAPSENVRT